MSFAPYIAAHRFGLGASPDEMRIIAQNPKKWLKDQIRPGASTTLQGNFKSVEEIAKSFGEMRGGGNEARKEQRKKSVDLFQQEMQARFNQAITTRTPLIERLVVFWSNHFTVSYIGKPQYAALMGAFEREAIRPHILGKFSDMLLASSRHPAMLLYLDNASSIGPNSKAGKKRKKGLNENLAREILELHTLGVDGGYTQNDVIEFAKIITGWTVTPPKEGGGGFRYVDVMHEPGTHTLLGKRYGQTGEEQGLAALMDIARHPSTARFIATKMATHFVADNPPEASIKKLESVFRRTDGDLRAMIETLIDMPEVWKDPLPKVKRPYEMLVANFRLAEAPAEKIPFKQIAQSLQLMEQVPFNAPSPAGWSDTADDWLSPNAMINRVEWCHAFAQRVRPKQKPLEIARAALGDVANPDTLLWIERAPSPVEGFALLLASPEWQRR